MIDKLLFEYKQKNKSNHTIKIKSHSLSRKTKKDDKNLSEAKTGHKPLNKNLHKRNILFNSKQNNINLKSTSTSSLSSSAEKKYLTPTKFNMQNYDNDYYFNESYNKTQEFFNNANISRPKLDYNSGHKKFKNILTIGTRLNTVNNNYNDNYEKYKVLLINRSFKVSKNKYVICRKNNFLNNIRVNKDEKDIESKSVENNHNFDKDKNNKKEENNDNEKINDIKILNKEKKYKNIVLRPHKIQKENQLKLKHNIKVNNYEIDDSPKIINKIMTRLNIKPKYSRVFKYK